MKNYIPPLTKTMLSKLLYCRRLELEGKSCLPEDIKYALAPLYKRGYIGLIKRTVNEKEMIVVFTTPEGIHCLVNFTAQNTAA